MLKVIKCESCNKKLDFSIRVCPECGGKARSLLKTPWFWGVIIVISIISSL